MWRKPFLLGVLCGTLMTAGLLMLAQALPPTRTTPGLGAAPPVRPRIAIKRSRGERLPPPLPRGWQAYPFNGQMVYVIPLACR
ncbi:MAG TPA: hypothetical protein VF278_17805 [Pirellulales bacterium]